jgi:hypothetical protein
MKHVGFAVFVLAGIAISLLIFPLSMPYLIIHCALGVLVGSQFFRGAPMDDEGGKAVLILFVFSAILATAAFLLLWDRTSEGVQAEIVKTVLSASSLVRPDSYLTDVAGSLRQTQPVGYLGVAMWLVFGPFFLVALFSKPILRFAEFLNATMIRPGRRNTLVVLGFALVCLLVSASTSFLNLYLLRRGNHPIMSWPYIYDEGMYGMILLNGAVLPAFALSSVLLLSACTYKIIKNT